MQLPTSWAQPQQLFMPVENTFECNTASTPLGKPLNPCALSTCDQVLDPLNQGWLDLLSRQDELTVGHIKTNSSGQSPLQCQSPTSIMDPCGVTAGTAGFETRSSSRRSSGFELLAGCGHLMEQQLHSPLSPQYELPSMMVSEHLFHNGTPLSSHANTMTLQSTAMPLFLGGADQYSMMPPVSMATAIATTAAPLLTAQPGSVQLQPFTAAAQVSSQLPHVLSGGNVMLGSSVTNSAARHQQLPATAMMRSFNPVPQQQQQLFQTTLPMQPATATASLQPTMHAWRHPGISYEAPVMTNVQPQQQQYGASLLSSANKNLSTASNGYYQMSVAPLSSAAAAPAVASSAASPTDLFGENILAYLNLQVC